MFDSLAKNKRNTLLSQLLYVLRLEIFKYPLFQKNVYEPATVVVHQLNENRNYQRY